MSGPASPGPGSGPGGTPAAPSGRDIFLSHASVDVAAARELRGALELVGYTCWMAPDDIVGTDAWSEQILAAINGARAMLVLVSDAANRSAHVSREVNLAISAGRPVLPVRIESVMPRGSLEYFLSLVQWVDAFPAPVADHLGRLLQRVEPIIGRPPATPAPPTSVVPLPPEPPPPSPSDPARGVVLEAPAPEPPPPPPAWTDPVPLAAEEHPRPPAAAPPIASAAPVAAADGRPALRAAPPAAGLPPFLRTRTGRFTWITAAASVLVALTVLRTVSGVIGGGGDASPTLVAEVSRSPSEPPTPVATARPTLETATSSASAVASAPPTALATPIATRRPTPSATPRPTPRPTPAGTPTSTARPQPSSTSPPAPTAAPSLAGNQAPYVVDEPYCPGAWTQTLGKSAWQYDNGGNAFYWVYVPEYCFYDPELDTLTWDWTTPAEAASFGYHSTTEEGGWEYLWFRYYPSVWQCYADSFEVWVTDPAGARSARLPVTLSVYCSA